MKTIKFMLAAALIALIVAGCGKKEKILVLYYSQTGNTKAVAEEIANRLGADIGEIEAMEPYNGDFQATIERCKQEMEQGITPKIKSIKANLSKYDVIFLGYPVWFGTYAPPIATFLRDNNLKGKKIVPFCTFGSGGLESSRRDIANAQPDAWILPSYGVRAARMESMPWEIDIFLKETGFIKGKTQPTASFPYPHPVMEKEIAIFDTAVNGYPMLNAEPVEVAICSTNGGVEYLFTAVDKPREEPEVADGKKPDLPPAGKLKVHVFVPKDGKPEFTRVVR